MKNYITEFYKQVTENKVTGYGGMEPSHIAAAIVLATGKIKEAIVFDFGDAESLENIKLEETYMMAPYPVVWCEISLPSDYGERGQFGFLVFDEQIDQNTKVIKNRFCLFLKKSGRWKLFNFGEFGSNALFACGNTDKYMQQVSMGVLGVYYRALLAMECTNVEMVENKPSNARKLINKGNLPLFSTWTLHIKQQPNQSKMNNGGTHQSPRVHLRRGHRRQYSAGKYTWVNPCMVGNKKLGMINKDYELD